MLYDSQYYCTVYCCLDVISVGVVVVVCVLVAILSLSVVIIIISGKRKKSKPVPCVNDNITLKTMIIVVFICFCNRMKYFFQFPIVDTIHFTGSHTPSHHDLPLQRNEAYVTVERVQMQRNEAYESVVKAAGRMDTQPCPEYELVH